jgi:hypothetical protein
LEISEPCTVSTACLRGDGYELSFEIRGDQATIIWTPAPRKKHVLELNHPDFFNKVRRLIARYKRRGAPYLKPRPGRRKT